SLVSSIVLIGIAALYIWLPEIDLMGDKRAEKVLEVYDTRAAGWAAGKKTFVIYSKYGWTNRTQDKAEFRNIYDGIIFKDGKVIIKKMKAGTVEVNSIKGETMVYGGSGGQSRTKALIDLKGDKRFSLLTCDQIRYNHGNNTAVFSGAPRLRSSSFTLESAAMEVLYDQKISNLSGKVQMGTKSRTGTDTVVRSDMARLSNDTYDTRFSNNVNVSQKTKKALCDFLTYTDSGGKLLLSGRVRVFFKNASQMIKKERAENLKNPEAKKALAQETKLTCGLFELSTKNSNAKAEQDVVVTQRLRQARSDNAVYDDDKETITLTGNVYLKKAKEWLKTKKVIVY
ncbi:MAG: LptA/OstA family protein, partial [Candidatus Margulisiibacteriota bacterium]